MITQSQNNSALIWPTMIVGVLGCAFLVFSVLAGTADAASDVSQALQTMAR